MKNYDVIGADVLKYFHRPAKSKFHYKDVIPESDKESTVYFSELHEKTEDEDSIKINKCTQTDYRESEAQTEPWDPPFTVIKQNQDPKVLLLKEFSYGNGLPATKLELDYIIQTLKNQKLMNELEKNNDNSDIRKGEIISNQVATKWDYRIKTEAQLQYKKLNEMKASVVKDLRKKSQKNEQMLQNMWSRKKSDINTQSVKLKEKLNKNLHSIENQFPVKENYSETSNIFGERREKNINHNIIDAKFSKEVTNNALSKHFLSSQNGISSIKELLEKKETVLKNEIPLPRLARRTEREKLAEEAYQYILFKHRTKLPPKVYHEGYESTETPLPAVKPDDVEEYLEEKESKVDMVTVWQQILRGLAYQKQMLELIERHKPGLFNSLSDTLS